MPLSTLEPRLLVLDVLAFFVQVTRDGDAAACPMVYRRDAPLAGDDPGDVRAVAVLVVERSGAVDGEVLVQAASSDRCWRVC